tara:strand:+ start:3691 stop:4125 length:435 start_codon:yes stop_codon:yes gene_type:complete
MNSKTKKILFNLLLILGTVVLVSVIVSSFISSKMYENFTTSLSPGKYPCTQDSLPLEGWYTAKKQPNVSELSMNEQYDMYPVYSAGSTEINNKRHWEQPENGKCSPPDMCGNVYEKLSIPKERTIQPAPSGSSNRVNFFNSEQN